MVQAKLMNGNLKLLVLLSALIFSGAAKAQRAWVVPANIDPNDTVTFYVDVKKCNCQRVLNADSLYFYTWLPRDRDTNESTANGIWTKSNEALRMTHAGNNIWYFKMVPTVFYGVSATTVYEKDFYFLVKKKDGTGIGGSGCDRDATEDLSVLVDPPISGPQKIKSFPIQYFGDSMSTSSTDVFTVIYNNNLEEKSTMKGQSDFYVFVQAIGSNGNTYTHTAVGNIGSSADLEMTNKGNGEFSWTCIPQNLMKSKMPLNIKVEALKVQIGRKKVNSGADLTDKMYQFYFDNDCQ